MSMNIVTNKPEWDRLVKAFGNPRYYVKMKDTFLSGWGHAEGKSNILIVPVWDLQDAYKLVSWVQWERKEMKYVDWNFIRKSPPKCIYDKTKLVQFSLMTEWYKRADIKVPEGIKEDKTCTQV